MRTVLIDIDTQIDFCVEGRPLYVPGADAPEARGAMARLVRYARAADWAHVASADDHVLTDPEIALTSPDWQATFPPHCMRGTDGARKIPETAQADPLVISGAEHELGDATLGELLAAHREILVLKRTTDVFTNPLTERVLEALAPERVVVFGVASDICVADALTGLIARKDDLGIERVVLAVDASRGLDIERTERLLGEFADAGVEITTVDELVAIRAAA